MRSLHSQFHFSLHRAPFHTSIVVKFVVERNFDRNWWCRRGFDHFDEQVPNILIFSIYQTIIII